MDFYVSALLSGFILSLFHWRPLHYGVLLPSTPAVAHILQDGHPVPLVDVPPQSLTRKVFPSKTWYWYYNSPTGLSWHRKPSSTSSFWYLVLVSAMCTLPSSPFSIVLRHSGKLSALLFASLCFSLFSASSRFSQSYPQYNYSEAIPEWREDRPKTIIKTHICKVIQI